MSTLLEQASLVMIPSGYKEDIVYSQIPTSGAGDLSFTRASNGTRINSAGLVEVVPWNLLLDTDTFSSWSLEGGTLTSGFTDPNGGSTAYKYVQVPGGGLYSGNIGVTADVKFAQIWIKSVSGSSLTCNISDGAAFFGTFNVTGTWQLFTAPYTANTRIGLYLYAISNASGIYVWHPQINIGSTAKPYFPTTDRLNVPRLTYQNGGGGCPSLLLEKQSTNYFPYSQNISLWFEPDDGVTLTSNTTDTVSPDGTYNASKIAIVGGNQRSYQITNSVSGVGTFSAYVKAGTSNTIVLYTSSASLLIGYNLSTLAVTQTTGTGTITSVGNGWYRITATNTLGASEVLQVLYTGTAGQTIYIWGFQVEASSYVTSYIFTNGASATRVADACFKTGISSLIGQTSGTIFVDFVWEGLGTANVDNPIFSIGEQSYGTSNIAISNYNSSLYGRVTNGTSVEAGVAFGAMTIGTRYKCAIGYASNDFVFYVNGANYGNDTSVSIPALSDAYFQNAYPNSKEVNQAILFKTRLTNAELASLTTI